MRNHIFSKMITTYLRVNSKQVRNIVQSAFLCMLCICMSGCGILGDGEVNIVTAPPLVTPVVESFDTYGEANPDKYDIGGTDAFYLLPGIENSPDYLQDFSCLNYTDDGYFIYYYCAPSYISIDEVNAYRGTEGVRKSFTYEEYDRTNSPCDAMIFMAYNPDTNKYKVLDAQGYSKATATSATDGRANTGVDFYLSENQGFYMLSHAYGCKISGTGEFFVFDQKGNARIYDKNLNLVSDANIGTAIMQKVKEIERAVKAENNGDKNISDLNSDATGDDESMSEGMEELEEATGESFESGAGKVKDMSLNCLIKSAVMDGTGQIYLSMMLYTGESPWSSDLLLNRVCSLVNIELDENYVNFVATNVNAEAQQLYYENYAKYGVTMQDIRNGFRGVARSAQNNKIYSKEAYDLFTPFNSEKAGEGVFVAGSPDNNNTTNKKVSKALPAEYMLDMAFPDDIFDDEYRMSSNAVKLQGFQDALKNMNLLPVMREFDPTTNIHRSDFPMNASDATNQTLFVVDMNFNDAGVFKAPRLFPIMSDKDTPGDGIYVEPYIYNRELVVYDTDRVYGEDPEKAAAIVQTVILEMGGRNTPSDFTAAVEDSFQKHGNYGWLFNDIIFGYGISAREGFDARLLQQGITAEDFGYALKGMVKISESEPKRIDSLTIPANTYPIAYRLVFPKEAGYRLEAADLDSAEGSCTSSIQKGVLLFSDEASIGADGTTYTGNIRYEVEDKKIFEDTKVPGSAIDTGALPYLNEYNNKEISMFMLITNEGVKFYRPVVKGGYVGDDATGYADIVSITYNNDKNNTLYITNEELLTSTGFTPYTESGTQAAVDKRMDENVAVEETYKDDNQVTVTQEEMTKFVKRSNEIMMLLAK